MSGVKRLEDDLRRTLRAAADALAVDDRAFDPESAAVVDLDELTRLRRSHRARWVGLIAVAAVLVVIGAALIAHAPTSSTPGKVGNSPPTTEAVTTTSELGLGVRFTPAPPALVAQVASVPAAALRAVGAGPHPRVPTPLPGPTLAEGGKPRIVWIGAEWCPYCAGQRWPLIVALSRFGTFGGLGVASSSRTTPDGAPEVFPNTRTFSFYGAGYSSPYVSFDPVETENAHFVSIERLPADIAQLQRKYDAAPYVGPAEQGSIPFVDFGNRYVSVGSTYDMTALQGKTAAEIASALSDPARPIAQAIDGSANIITATICALTNDRPASVCADPSIAAIEAGLGR